MQTDLYLSICARKNTETFKDGDYSHMLSMLDPHERYDDIVIPSSAHHQGRIMFHDLDDIEVRAPKYCTYIPPQKEHIRQIMEFFQHVRAHNGHGVLIHCEAGISRSTASGIIGLCSLGIDPEAAFNYVTGLIDMALPNRRMLRLADEMLGHQVKLADLAERRRNWLYETYQQPDPLKQLEEELNRKSWFSLRKERMQTWANYGMKYLRAVVNRKRQPPGKPSCFLKPLHSGAMA